MNDCCLNYEKLVEDALRTVVREALRRVASDGLPTGHHLYISFKTRAKGVQIADNLREQFPDEMTIVLQNQYWDLKVDDAQFRVTLNFNKVPRQLVIPLAALSGFADQRANFGLQFGKDPLIDKTQESTSIVTGDETKKDPPTTEQDDARSGPKIVTLDAFRKNSPNCGV